MELKNRICQADIEHLGKLVEKNRSPKELPTVNCIPAMNPSPLQ